MSFHCNGYAKREVGRMCTGARTYVSAGVYLCVCPFGHLFKARRSFQRMFSLLLKGGLLCFPE